MADAPLQDGKQSRPTPVGHVIGFIDTQTSCDTVIETLMRAGVSKERIHVLQVQSGIAFLQQMMEGF